MDLRSIQKPLKENSFTDYTDQEQEQQAGAGIGLWSLVFGIGHNRERTTKTQDRRPKTNDVLLLAAPGLCNLRNLWIK